ncbi:MAG: nucleoside triphosphate pyrophosphohydrolase [Clostridia bacterium]|nr:nucleoside triphosphate pyrophosphohydrolase [Clostridia bacterium]
MLDFYSDAFTFDDLVELMAFLRAPGGCPWDAAQSHESIRRNFIEEVYEAVEAIDNKDVPLLKEELGDVLLQVVFHAQICAEAGEFDMGDVCTGIVKKLIRRHPDLFPVSPDLQGKSWDEIKQAEKRLTSGSKDAAQVARSLPALIYADKVQTRVARTGFDWPDAEMAMSKVEEEAAELRQALTDNTNVEEELGDLLFAAVNVARLRGLDPEETLMRATDKFRRRFAKVEEAAGDKLAGMGIDEMVTLWKQAKEEA